MIDYYETKSQPNTKVVNGTSMRIAIFGWLINMKSRVKGDFHARFCGNVGVKFPCVTRLFSFYLACFDSGFPSALHFSFPLPQRKHFIYICHSNKLFLVTNRYLFTTLVLAILISASACSKKLMSVLVEDPNGNVELIYVGSQMPDNLVKEIRFYPGGDTLSVTPMKKGAVDGAVSYYHANNLLKEVSTFDNGIQNGSFKRFDKEGVLVFEGQLKNGKKEGVWTTWYDEVQMEEQRTYQNDLAEGKWTYWYIDGNVKREETYNFGKLIEGKDFN